MYIYVRIYIPIPDLVVAYSETSLRCLYSVPVSVLVSVPVPVPVLLSVAASARADAPSATSQTAPLQ